MIRITIELVPLGIEESTRTLGKIIIFNDGTGSHTEGNYVGRLSSGNQKCEVQIKNFPRVLSLVNGLPGSMALLYRVLSASQNKFESIMKDKK